MTVTTYTDAVEIDGSQDIAQLKVQGHSTQTEPLQVWEDSAAEEQAQITGDGRLQIGSFASGMMATDDALIEAHRDAADTAKPARGLHLLGEVSGTLSNIVAWAVQELVLKGTGGISALHTALRVRLTNTNTGTMDSGADLRAADVEIINDGGGVSEPVPEITGLHVAVTNEAGAYADAAYGIRVRIADDGSLGQAYAIHTDQGIVHLGDSLEIPVVAETPTIDPPVGFVLMYTKLAESIPQLYLKDSDGEEYVLGSGGGGGEEPEVTYLLYDGFDTDDAAPITSPRTAEPGPGDLVATDSTDLISIDDGRLVFAGGLTTDGDPGVWSDDAFTRASGLALMATLNRGSSPFGPFKFGFDSNQAGAPTVHSIGWQSSKKITLYSSDSAAVLGISTEEAAENNTDYQFALVLRAAGAYYLVKGDIYTDWTLYWVAGQMTTSGLYAAVQSYNAQMFVDNFRVVELTGDFADDTIATLNVTTPASGSTEVATADGIHDFDFTLPGSPSAAQKIELRYRVQDVNNYWTAYVERNGGNTDWDFKLDSVSGGTPTNRISVNGVGTPNRVRVSVRGTKHDAYTLAGTTWSKQGSQVNVSHLNVETALSPVYPGAAAGNALQSWPRLSTKFDALDEV